jgi:RimJ/RimL family protein N-acetyltransferase
VSDRVLRPLERGHLPALAALIADPDVLRFTRIPVPVPDGFVDAWFGSYEAGRRDGTRAGFAIEDAGGGFLGLALAPEIDREARTVELGYIVAPAARGRGVATAALRELTAWTFNAVGALRIELRISVDNPASKRVAERCGYALEGVMRSVYVKPGLREDVELWSRLAGDGASPQ